MLSELSIIIKAVLTIVIIPLSIFLSIWLCKRYKGYLYNEKKCNSHQRNLLLIFAWIFPTIITGIILYSIWGIIEPDGVAKVDLIIAFTTIVGVIGAAWAVFARIDAEKAFNQAKLTHEALGTTFSFSEILDSDRLPSIIKNIGQQGTKVTLFLGIPCVGLFYKDRIEELGKGKIIKVFNELINDLNELVASNNTNVFVCLGLFKKDIAIKYLKESGFDFNHGTRDLIEEYGKVYDELMRLKVTEKFKDCIKIIEIEPQKEYFRFASVYNERDGIHKAIVWVVPDLPTLIVHPVTNIQQTKNSKQKTPAKNGKSEEGFFDSACFQTSDRSLIRILQSVFDNQG